MAYYDCYHGTNKKAARKIFNDKKLKISDNIGSLGKGAYAFLGNSNDAKEYALRRRSSKSSLDEIAIIKFKILKGESIIDLRTSKYIGMFKLFRRGLKHKELSHFHNSKINHANKLDGQQIDMFIELIENKFLQHKVLGVIAITQNDFGDTPIPYTNIGNSTEVCIKSTTLQFHDMEIIYGDDLNEK